MNTQDAVAQARWHYDQGQGWLAAAAGGTGPGANVFTGYAQAHFQAGMLVLQIAQATPRPDARRTPESTLPAQYLEAFPAGKRDGEPPG